MFDRYVFYCMKYVNMLLSFEIKPIMVFDGCRLPSKQEVEKARRERRNANRKKAAQLLREGKRSEARDCLVQCVDITAEMALELMNACREKGVDCIVAPYEADAQLAYLDRIGLVDVVITEDSDLVLFGCEKIMFKMDINGNGLLVERSKLGPAVDLPSDQFTFEKFRRVCILSGCDYLPSLPGIGLAKATKAFRLSRQSDIRQLIKRIPVTLKMPSLVVPNDYVDNFIRAENTFLYQLVYDPVQRKAVPLNPYPPGLEPSDVQYAGPSLSEEMAFQIAVGNVDVNSGRRIADFDPDTFRPRTNGFNQRAGDTLKRSIWSRDSEFSEERQRRRKGKGKEEAQREDPSSPERKDGRIERPTTKGKEIMITVPIHKGGLLGRAINNNDSSCNNNNGTKNELISDEKVPPSETELLKIYAAGKEESDFTDPVEDPGQDPRDESTPVPEKRVTTATTPRSSSKTPNMFAVRSEDSGPGKKKKFSLDGCPSTPKSENKCRFFVASPEPVRQSDFFVKLKQADSAEKTPAGGAMDIVEADGSMKTDGCTSGKSGGEVRSRLSAFSSRYSERAHVRTSSKRSLFATSDDDNDCDKESNSLSMPKKSRLDALINDGSEESGKKATPKRRSIFGASAGPIGAEKVQTGSSDRRGCSHYFGSEDPLSDVTDKRLNCSDARVSPAEISPGSEGCSSDEDPLGEIRPKPNPGLPKVPSPEFEDERVLSDEEETEDPLYQFCRGRRNENREVVSKFQKEERKFNGSSGETVRKKSGGGNNSGGCKPSGLSKCRGRPKNRDAQQQQQHQQQQDSSFKQSSLSDFFRANFAHSKDIERFPRD